MRFTFPQTNLHCAHINPPRCAFHYAAYLIHLLQDLDDYPVDAYLAIHQRRIVLLQFPDDSDDVVVFPESFDFFASKPATFISILFQHQMLEHFAPRLDVAHPDFLAHHEWTKHALETVRAYALVQIKCHQSSFPTASDIRKNIRERGNILRQMEQFKDFFLRMLPRYLQFDAHLDEYTQATQDIFLPIAKRYLPLFYVHNFPLPE
jgi:hypothetical protein